MLNLDYCRGWALAAAMDAGLSRDKVELAVRSAMSVIEEETTEEEFADALDSVIQGVASDTDEDQLIDVGKLRDR